MKQWKRKMIWLVAMVFGMLASMIPNTSLAGSTGGQQIPIDAKTRRDINLILQRVDIGDAIQTDKSGHRTLMPLTNSNLVAFGVWRNFEDPIDVKRIKALPWTPHFKSVKNIDGDLQGIPAEFVDQSAFQYFGKRVINQSTKDYHFENGFYYMADMGAGDYAPIYHVKTLISTGKDTYIASGSAILDPATAPIHWKAGLKKITTQGNSRFIVTSYTGQSVGHD